jgi:hypothetical protein
LGEEIKPNISLGDYLDKYLRGVIKTFVLFKWNGKKLQQAQALGSEQKRMTLFWNAVRTTEPIASLDLCIGLV